MNRFFRIMILVSVFLLCVPAFEWLFSGNIREARANLLISFFALLYLHQREVFNMDGRRAKKGWQIIRHRADRDLIP